MAKKKDIAELGEEITTLEHAKQVIVDQKIQIEELQEEVKKAVQASNASVAAAAKQINGTIIIAHEGEQYQLLKTNLLVPKIGKVSVETLQNNPEIMGMMVNNYPNVFKKITA